MMWQDTPVWAEVTQGRAVAFVVGILVTGFGMVAPNVARSTPPDTLHLDALRAAAAANDPRSAQPELLERANQARLESLGAGRLPQFAVTGQATVQSDVPSIPVDLPDQTIPHPPLWQSRVQAETDWTLYDGGRIGSQMGVQEARFQESRAEVAVRLYAIEEATTDVYFAALLSQSRAQTLELAARDLEVQLELVRRQVEHGAALHTDAAALEAEWIRIRQQIDEAESDSRASLAVLADLTGVPVDSTVVLAVPELDDLVAAVAPDENRQPPNVEPGVEKGLVTIVRPELARFARRKERLLAEAEAVETRNHPEVSLFGQAGVGRPSPFDPFGDELRPFALAGIRLRWSPIDWGRARKQAETLQIQADIADLEREAFAAHLNRSIEKDRAAIARLQGALPQDERAIELREEVVRVARRQFTEGVLFPAAYVDRLTDLVDARLTRERHRIELAYACARLLSTLGLYPDPEGDTFHRQRPNR